MSVFFVIMKNLTLFILFVGVSNLINSQEKKAMEIYGTISLDSIPLENVHVINKNTSIVVITNAKGAFKITTSETDTLFISHISIKNKEVRITKEMYVSRKIVLNIEAASYFLDEIVLKKRRSIFYVDPEIMPAYMVNATTLKLPFTNMKKISRADSLDIRFKSGLSINLVGLLNSLNGNAKRAKQLKKLKITDSELLKIRKLFSDFFFEKQLGIQKPYINQFLNFCVTKNIISHFKKGNQLKLTEILIKESKIFPYKKMNEETLLTNN